MPYKVTGLRSWYTNTEVLDATVRFYRDVLGAHDGAGLDPFHTLCEPGLY
jgi:hypothetical protein